MITTASELDAGASLEEAPATGHRKAPVWGVVGNVGRRLLHTSFVLLVVFTITFALIHVIPGDPARMILGKSATQDAVDALREELGLNEPILTQFWNTLSGIFHGDFGTSLVSGTQSVTSIISPAYTNTIGVVALALIFSLIIGISVGVFAGMKGSGLTDVTVQAVLVVLLATPPFMFGFLLLLLALYTGVAPAGGWNENPFDSLQYMWLPALALSAALAPIIGRSLRQTIRETMHEDFVESAIARGLPQRHIILKHVLPNSLLPLVGLIGYSLGGLIGGATVVEVVFNIPGMGAAMMQAVGSRDFPVIQGIALISAVTVIFFNAMADVAYWVIDPRTRSAS